jgi:hypothetical protein
MRPELPSEEVPETKGAGEDDPTLCKAHPWTLLLIKCFLSSVNLEDVPEVGPSRSIALHAASLSLDMPELVVSFRALHLSPNSRLFFLVDFTMIMTARPTNTLNSPTTMIKAISAFGIRRAEWGREGGVETGIGICRGRRVVARKKADGVDGTETESWTEVGPRSE